MLQIARARLSPLALRPLVRAVTMSASEGKSTEAEGPLYDHKSPASEVYGSIHTPSEESQQGSKSQSASESESGATHKDRDPKSKNHKVTGGNDFNELKKMHNEGRD